MTTIRTVCICGAGTMGRGIAQVTATAGFRTILFDVNTAVLQQAETHLHGDLKKLVLREKCTAEAANAISNHIQFTTDINHCTAHLIIEAIVEQEAPKVNLFNQLAAINAAETIFATNTSSLSVSAIAQHIPHPHRVAGLHFFNPAPLMKLVEVIRARHTANYTIETLLHFVNALGKTAVVCHDAPGFIVNRVARPYYIETLRLLEENKVSIETADRLLESAGFKLGPFRLMDLIGNDVNHAVSCSVYNQLGQPERLRPSPLQQQKVADGQLGKKTGRGFYSY